MDKKKCIDQLKAQLKKAQQHLEGQLLTIRTGKASPSMLQGVQVEYYGTPTPLDQVASLAASDARTITIQPWEKNLIPAIEKAILQANLGFNPVSNGEQIRVPVPPLTEERRKEFVKRARGEGETTKTVLRNARRDANDTIKKLQKEGLSEDEAKVAMADIQKLLDEAVQAVDKMVSDKEREIMTV